MRENRKCFLFSSGWDEDKVRCSTNRQGKEFHQQTRQRVPPTDKEKISTNRQGKIFHRKGKKSPTFNRQGKIYLKQGKTCQNKNPLRNSLLPQKMKFPTLRNSIETRKTNPHSSSSSSSSKYYFLITYIVNKK